MFRTVFTKTLYDQRRSLLGWSIGVVLMTGLMVALWPSVRDIPDLEQFLANYPEAMRDLFNIQSLSTGAGFLNAELFSSLAPVLFLVFGIARGARLIASEEEEHTLDVLLATPLSRTRVAAEKALALVVSVALLGLVLFLTLVVSGPVVDLEVGIAQLAAASTGMVLLGTEFGLLAAAVGAATGRRTLAIGVASAVAVTSYLLFAFGRILDAFEPWIVLSPFQHALGNEPLVNGLSIGYAAAMLAVGLVLVMGSLPLFARRDIAV